MSMTMELLCRLIEENNIPRDVYFVGDFDACGIDPVDMDGVYYDRENNTMYFTQGDEQGHESLETLYTPNLIKIGDISVYPVRCIHGYGLEKRFKEEIKAAGEFESFYGIREEDSFYDEIKLRRPLFYCIKIRGEFIGYIGFAGDEDALELEIYIFEEYRNKGYGSRVLKKLIDVAFKEGLWKEKEEMTSILNPPRAVWKEEKVFPKKLISTVRVENENSQRMMKACGFIENTEVAAIFRGFIGEDDEVFDPVEVKEYYLTKEQYLKGER